MRHIGRHKIPQSSLPGEGTIILSADDFAMTSGICDGIEELAAADCISATSAIVTLPSWAKHGPRLARLRTRLAIGLHLNLTLGTALGPLPQLAPRGEFPTLRSLLTSCLFGRAQRKEVADEVLRQIDRFEEVTGQAPDFIDGHQHVHAFPGIRAGLIQALSRRFSSGRPLVRNPFDSPVTIIKRGGAQAKALGLAALSTGFGSRLRNAGLPTNHGFAGLSTFSPFSPYGEELEMAFRFPGRRHLVMCHPGYPDAELERLDTVVERRREELAVLLAAPRLRELIWHISDRDENGFPIWPGHDAP